MNMTMSQILVFHAVAETGTVRDAAAKLGVTKAAIAHQLRQMNHLELFFPASRLRSTMGQMTLTPKGHTWSVALRSHIYAIFDTAKELGINLRMRDQYHYDEQPEELR